MLTEVELRTALTGPIQDLGESFVGEKLRGTHVFNNVLQEKLLSQMSQPETRRAVVQKFALNSHETACRLALLMLLEADGGFEQLKAGGWPASAEDKRPLIFPLGAMYLNRFIGQTLIQLTAHYQRLGRIPNQDEIKAAPRGTYPRFGEIIGIQYGIDFPVPQSALGELMLGGPERLRALRSFWPEPKDALVADLIEHRQKREAALSAAFAKGKEYVSAAMLRIHANPAGTYNVHMQAARDLLNGEITFQLQDSLFMDWSTGKERENIYDPLKSFLVDPPVEAPPGKPFTAFSKGLVRSVNAGRFLNAATPDDKLPVNVNDSGWVRTPNAPGQPTGERKFGTYHKKLPDPFRTGVRYYSLAIIPEKMIDRNK